MKLELRFLDQDGIKHCPNLICNSCLLWICHSLYQWALLFMWGRKDNMLRRQRGLKTTLLWYSPHILETNALPVLILEYRSEKLLDLLNPQYNADRHQVNGNYPLLSVAMWATKCGITSLKGSTEQTSPWCFWSIGGVCIITNSICFDYLTIYFSREYKNPKSGNLATMLSLIKQYLNITA